MKRNGTYALTAKQIREIDEIAADKASASMTLKVALNFHANIVSGLAKKEKEWWKEIGDIHNLDMGVTWKVVPTRTEVVVERAEKEE